MDKIAKTPTISGIQKQQLPISLRFLGSAESTIVTVGTLLTLVEFLRVLAAIFLYFLRLKFENFGNYKKRNRTAI